MFEAKVEELQKARGDDVKGSEVTGQVPDARLTLILDLSSKVTEQENEIIRLRELLCQHNLSPGGAGTLAVHSSELSKPFPKPSDTGWSKHLHSPTQENNGTESADRHGVWKGSSNPPYRDVRSIPPIGKLSDVKNSFTLSRTSQGSGGSYSKNCSKQEKNAASSYRAHWASSCFDVDDLTSDYVGEETTAGVSGDQLDCVRVNSVVSTAGAVCTETPLNLRKGAAPRVRHQRQNSRGEPEHQKNRTSNKTS